MTNRRIIPITFTIWVILSLINCGGAKPASSSSSSSSSSGSSSSSSSSSSGTITGANCQTTGNQTVNAPGQIYDGECKTFNPNFGNGTQEEGQPPVFKIENGGSLKNVIIGANGADGIHTYGDAIVENITWTDVGEDALTVKSAGKVTVRNITGASADDKFFQLNAQTTFVLENCKINGAGKVFRENGNKCFPVNITVNHCEFNNIKEAIFRSDCNNSTFSLSNSQLINVRSICYPGGTYKICGEI
jgi:pectate lyase C